MTNVRRAIPLGCLLILLVVALGACGADPNDAAPAQVGPAGHGLEPPASRA